MLEIIFKLKNAIFFEVVKGDSKIHIEEDEKIIKGVQLVAKRDIKAILRNIKVKS